MIFKDLKVMELASVLAGPSVGQFFAELGAEVIKVENLTTNGDVTRSWKISGEKEGDVSAYFCSVNWGKKSLAVDLSQPEGRRIIQRLSAQTDVIITSYKPGDAEKLGVDYKTLSDLNAKLIYGQITGYGSRNARVGYDAVIQAEAGFIDLNGEKNGPPTKMPVALIDVLAGHQMKESLLLALLKRERTGQGELVEVSLLQTAISSLINQASNWLVVNKLPQRQGSAHPNIAPYGESFETADGKLILLAVGSDRQFADLCTVLGLDAVANDDRYSSNPRRVENRLDLNRLISKKISQFLSGPLLVKMNSLKIPAGVIQNIKEALDMPEAKELFIRSGSLTGIRSFVANTENLANLLPPPHCGEHTALILQAAGYSFNEMENLKRAQIIRSFSQDSS
jgi:crotonobetainyl-CoA:carnitine CoA-transferase CaiB-like acyl-CoA transferase